MIVTDQDISSEVVAIYPDLHNKKPLKIKEQGAIHISLRVGTFGVEIKNIPYQIRKNGGVWVGAPRNAYPNPDKKVRQISVTTISFKDHFINRKIQNSGKDKIKKKAMQTSNQVISIKPQNTQLPPPPIEAPNVKVEIVEIYPNTYKKLQKKILEMGTVHLELNVNGLSIEMHNFRYKAFHDGTIWVGPPINIYLDKTSENGQVFVPTITFHDPRIFKKITTSIEREIEACL